MICLAYLRLPTLERRIKVQLDKDMLYEMNYALSTLKHITEGTNELIAKPQTRKEQIMALKLALTKTIDTFLPTCDNTYTEEQNKVYEHIVLQKTELYTLINDYLEGKRDVKEEV